LLATSRIRRYSRINKNITRPNRPEPGKGQAIMRDDQSLAGTPQGHRALLLCGLMGLPLAVLADSPVTSPSARPAALTDSTQPSGRSGSEPERDSTGDWDGLVTLVVSYLEVSSNATVTVALAEPAT
jgi:hypothetical protein